VAVGTLPRAELSTLLTAMTRRVRAVRSPRAEPSLVDLDTDAELLAATRSRSRSAT
jgi:hypothetical protein